MGCDTFGPKRICSQTHLVPNAYGPRTFGPPQLVPNWLVYLLDKRAPTNSVPMDKWSPKFCPHGQMVPNQFCPPGQMVFRIFCLSKGTDCGDLETLGPNWLGSICPEGPNFLGPFVLGGPNLMGTVCQGGSILWGLFFQSDRKWGTRRPGIKWVRD